VICVRFDIYIFIFMFDAAYRRRKWDDKAVLGWQSWMALCFFIGLMGYFEKQL